MICLRIGTYTFSSFITFGFTVFGFKAFSTASTAGKFCLCFFYFILYFFCVYLPVFSSYRRCITVIIKAVSTLCRNSVTSSSSRSGERAPLMMMERE